MDLNAQMISLTVSNFSEWRNCARTLLEAATPPAQVSWQTEQQSSLFDAPSIAPRPSGGARGFTVPPAFLSHAKQAACFIDTASPSRKWAILYSLLWRLVKVDKRTMSLKSDSEVQALQRMSSAVSRDKHKMKAFVRFQHVANSAAEPIGNSNLLTDKPQVTDYYTSWFEPDHAIVEAIAPFFVKRFTGMSWSILTPHGCAHWDQKCLKLSDGVARPAIKDDEFDEFWRVYYKSIFNPARLKEQAMRSEMPKKYWKYLPEASCIKDLARDAGSRTNNMVAAELTNSDRVRLKSDALAQQQDGLRAVNRQ